MTTSRPAASANIVADTTTIRAHFPAMERRHNGHPVAYFDGPGGTQVPRAVANAMTDYLFHHNANTHWLYPTSEETDALIANARATLADFLNASASEIAFGNNMTTLLFHVSRAIGRMLNAGDEIIVTELDHHANIAPWQALERERGVVLKWVPLDVHTSHLDMEAYAKLLSPRTKLVAVGAASNALGTVSDVRNVVQMARAVGAITVVDAVHYAPHYLVDVRDIDCDILACSAYKFYGPHIGVLYMRASLLESLDIPKLEPAPDSGPERLETGTQNHEGMIGAAAAVEWLASLSPESTGTRRDRIALTLDALHHRGDALLSHLWDGIGAMSWVTPVGPLPGTRRTATLSMRVAGGADNAARHLATRGLFASSGDFYAKTVVERIGAAEEGLLRIGCMAYTTEQEIDRLLAALHELRP
jgi:cysteine desulfurase family protein (TIGR01976 family)